MMLCSRENSLSTHRLSASPSAGSLSKPGSDKSPLLAGRLQGSS
ncbi:rCG47161 [Rattus norvegicus]|uniref:RCG47161 n=1 Tax=Rattus norvegicus TaxID=10116 RepID=A6HWY3_RAT|nr:rCG47161 [Rattus norvegicus]